MNAHSPERARFRSAEAAAYLSNVHGVTIAPRTLDKLRSTGGGPAFQKFRNRVVLYPRDALDAWALEKLGQLVRSTSEPGGA